MSQIAFHFFCHTGKTVIAFKKQWYNAVTPRDPRTTPLAAVTFINKINLRQLLICLITLASSACILRECDRGR